MRLTASLLFGAFALAALGAGCRAVPAMPPVEPGIPAPPPSLTSPVAVLPDGWREDSLNGTWIFAHPGTSTRPAVDDPDRLRGLRLILDLGTAVEHPGSRSVPNRTLKAWAVDSDSPDLAAACTRPLHEGDPSPKVVESASGVRLCLQVSREGAAGNLYDTRSYYLIPPGGTSVQAYAFAFTTHSVQCLNYEHPAEQCVSFDEARDTELFGRIMRTVRRVP